MTNYIIAYLGIGLVSAIAQIMIAQFRHQLDNTSAGVTGFIFILIWLLWPIDVALIPLKILCQLIGYFVKGEK